MLHHVGLYLSYAKKRAQFPWGGQAIADSEVTLRNASYGKAEKQSLQGGLHVLKAASDLDLDLQYSAVAQLELLSARIRGKAITKAAREGLPDRIWSRLRERAIRDRVSKAEVERISAGVREIAQVLETFDLAEQTTARKATADAIELACEIVGLVYMEPLDSIVYASALRSGADLIFTSDGPLRDTVNRIREPGGAGDRSAVRRFREIQKQIRRLVTGTDNPSDKFALPSAHRVTPTGTWTPALQ